MIKLLHGLITLPRSVALAGVSDDSHSQWLWMRLKACYVAIGTVRVFKGLSEAQIISLVKILRHSAWELLKLEDRVTVT